MTVKFLLLYSYGSTTGMIWLDNVRCSGTESRLTNCLTTILGSNDCSHSEDVAIECNDGPGSPYCRVVITLHTCAQSAVKQINSLLVCLSIFPSVYSVTVYFKPVCLQ